MIRGPSPRLRYSVLAVLVRAARRTLHRSPELQSPSGGGGLNKSERRLTGFPASFGLAARGLTGLTQVGSSARQTSIARLGCD
jgi:hypothetical protein